MNKSTKIWLNYLLGAAISTALLWGIYVQVKDQLGKVDSETWWHSGPSIFLLIGILLMPVNLALETLKWKILVGSAQPVSYKQAFASLLAGNSLSIVTPNRIGEYPGRILYLQRKNTFRLIGVSVLGACAQLLTVFLFGIIGLIYYNITYPGRGELIALIGSVLAITIVAFLYWRFEYWMPILEKTKWIRRFQTYSQLLKRFSKKEQLTILILSILRFGVYTTQYLLLLYWMNIDIPVLEGFYTIMLFFWALAIIPSIALTELGVRGQVSIYLFHHYTTHIVGILAATIGLWFINLMIPAVIGSILLLRMRILR
ncbi:MAG: lysylphosphatidylglycerol synthase domain-containing protein [Bacteroidota bacterium]